MTTLPPTSAPTLPFRHRGFGLAICAGAGASAEAPAFGFTVVHAGLTLHTSRAEFRSPGAADRAARRFIDDALGSYEYATRALAA